MEPRFGEGFLPSDFQTGRIVPRSAVHQLSTGYRRPWAIARQAVHEMKDRKHLLITKDGFHACVDVHHFDPSEVSVKTVDNTITIEGKHEERDDKNGSVERHFIRKYQLPKEYDIKSVHTTLSNDGVLTIKAPPPPNKETGERHIPISFSNVPFHVTAKSCKPREDEKNKK